MKNDAKNFIAKVINNKEFADAVAKSFETRKSGELQQLAKQHGYDCSFFDIINFSIY